MWTCRPRRSSLPMVLLGCYVVLGGCAAGPQFVPPPVPSAAQYTSTRQPDDEVSPGENAQHIALGKKIEARDPKIQLTATATQQALAADQLFNRASNAWSLISGLTAPVFDGGTLRAEKRAAVDTMHASAADYEETVLEAFAQVADLLRALDHDAEQLDAQAQAQQAAQSSLDLARLSYQEGNVGVLQVLDAERMYQQARLGYVRTVAQRYGDTVQLFLALGGTSPVEPLPLASAHETPY